MFVLKPREVYKMQTWSFIHAVCLQMSSLSWLERKTAATLYKTPPTTSVNDALENFLKVLLSVSFFRTKLLGLYLNC